MRFLFLNQYAPPDPAPTARLLGELAAYLQANGHEVEFISQIQDYHHRPTVQRGRLRREMAALFTIFRAAWQATRRKPDLLLALSSPPGLLVVAALLARLRKANLAHWAMDLYPELALVLGEVKPGIIFRILSRAMGWAYRRAALIVVLDDDMRAHFRATYQVDSRIMAPWPEAIFEQQAATSQAESSEHHDVSWVWLYSGNLGRAHEWVTLLEIQRLLESRDLPIRLVFQGDGAARPAAMERAAQLRLQRCEWKGYAAKDELISTLLDARLLIVTQRPETCGLLWPSKLAALEKLPRPILYIGPTDGAIAARLSMRGNAGVFAPGDAEAAARWIEGQLALRTSPTSADGFKPTAARDCATLGDWLLECACGSK